MGERKVILYIAESLDGFIAKEDGDTGWLSIVERAGEDYGYNDFIRGIDTVIMGRKTYEKVLSFGIEFPHKGRKCYVLSHSRNGTDQNVEFYQGDAGELIRMIRGREGKNIFIDGGSEVVRELKSLGLIDEYVVSVIPVFIGKGIRLFQDVEAEARLELLEHKAFPSGLVQLRYRVIK